MRIFVIGLAAAVSACQNGASGSSSFDGQRLEAAAFSVMVPKNAKTSGFDPAVIQEDYPRYSIEGQGYRLAIDFTEQPLGQSSVRRVKVANRGAVETIEALEGGGKRGLLGFQTRTSGENYSPVVIWQCAQAIACDTVATIISSMKFDWDLIDNPAPPPPATKGQSPYPEMPPPPPQDLPNRTP